VQVGDMGDPDQRRLGMSRASRWGRPGARTSRKAEAASLTRSSESFTPTEFYPR
jgi:hypothetical protein